MIFTYHGYFGFDLSTYQDSPDIPGVVDFRKMADYGASFVIIKAGQGNWIDPDFFTNWHNSKGTLPRAPYWYYDNHYNPKAQARKYWDIIKIDPEGICWIDLEDRSGGDYWSWNDWYDFIEEFRRVSGMPYERIGIYTAYYYWVESTKSATTAQLSYFAKFPLWLAAYGVKGSDPLHPNYTLLMCPPPWSSPLIIQTGTPAIGRAAGVESEDIDYDQFNGGAAEFERTFGAIPQEVTMSQVIKGTVLGTIKRRDAPAGNEFTPPLYLYRDDKIEASENSAQWLHLTKINGAPVMGTEWASAGASQQYITWAWADVVIPPPPPVDTGPVLKHTIKVYSDGSIDVDGVPAN